MKSSKLNVPYKELHLLYKSVVPYSLHELTFHFQFVRLRCYEYHPSL